MEFELVEKPRNDDRERPGDSPVIRKHRANANPPGSPQARPHEDQAVLIPEQEDG